RERWLFGLAALIMIAGVLFGGITTAADPDTAVVFLPAVHLVESPAHRVARLEKQERQGDTRISTVGHYSALATFLFTHNIRVIVLGFALGLTFGIGTTMALFYNGAMLGCLAWRYWHDGVMMFFLGWVGPHGSIELPCIV